MGHSPNLFDTPAHVAHTTMRVYLGFENLFGAESITATIFHFITPPESEQYAIIGD